MMSFGYKTCACARNRLGCVGASVPRRFLAGRAGNVHVSVSGTGMGKKAVCYGNSISGGGPPSDEMMRKGRRCFIIKWQWQKRQQMITVIWAATGAEKRRKCNRINEREEQEAIGDEHRLNAVATLCVVCTSNSLASCFLKAPPKYPKRIHNSTKPNWLLCPMVIDVFSLVPESRAIVE